MFISIIQCDRYMRNIAHIVSERWQKHVDMQNLHNKTAEFESSLLDFSRGEQL
jgi:hypothetical protein